MIIRRNGQAGWAGVIGSVSCLAHLYLICDFSRLDNILERNHFHSNVVFLYFSHFKTICVNVCSCEETILTLLRVGGREDGAVFLHHFIYLGRDLIDEASHLPHLPNTTCFISLHTTEAFIIKTLYYPHWGLQWHLKGINSQQETEYIF